MKQRVGGTASLQAIAEADKRNSVTTRTDVGPRDRRKARAQSGNGEVNGFYFAALSDRRLLRQWTEISNYWCQVAFTITWRIVVRNGRNLKFTSICYTGKTAIHPPSDTHDGSQSRQTSFRLRLPDAMSCRVQSSPVQCRTEVGLLPPATTCDSETFS